MAEFGGKVLWTELDAPQFPVLKSNTLYLRNVALIGVRVSSEIPK